MTTRTALTGFLVPRAKVYGNGFFSKESLDPDNYNDYLTKLHKDLKDKFIDKRKHEIQLLKDEKFKLLEHQFMVEQFEYINGRLVLHRRPKILKNKDDNRVIIYPRNASSKYVKTYRNENGLTLTEQNRLYVHRRHAIIKTEDDRAIIHSRKYDLKGRLRIKGYHKEGQNI